MYVVCCTGADTRFSNCEDDDFAIPLAVCEERILARDPNCEICAFVGHINLQTNDEQEGISLVQTSHTLVSSTPQALQNPVFVPSSVPGVEQNTHSTVPDLHLRTVDPPLAVVPDAPLFNNPYRKWLHFPIIYTPVTRYPPIKVSTVVSMDNSQNLSSYCTFCGTASSPDNLEIADHNGLFAYCPTCISMSSQSEDFSSHAQASSSTAVSPFSLVNASSHTLHDSTTMHDSSFSAELCSTSVSFSAELGSSTAVDVSSELGSPSPELSQSASAAGISSCTSCDLSVTFAPVAEDLYGLQHA
jgi:hypothetical protein